ncbi:MAG: sulfotransferase [Solirubrobacteraceae bacterium]
MSIDFTRRLLGKSRRKRRRAAPTDGGLDRPPPPPPCPPGARTGAPDFIGVGVQRCGTTRWFDLISSHPEVTRPVGAKELHFFDRFYEGPYTEADTAEYHRYFPRAGEEKVGEWTPLYLSAPWIPRLLATAAPAARLIVLLRDPLERYRSGLELDAGVAARRGAPLSRYAPLEAFVRGLYHSQLANLMRHFDRSAVLVLQYERCTREPETQLRRTFEFLGLTDTDFVPDLAAHPKHQPEKPTLDAATREAYVSAYSDDVVRLAAAFPEIDLELWPNFTHLATS